MVETKYLRKKKAEFLNKWYNNKFKSFEPSLLEISNGIILPLKKIEGDELAFGRGGVIDGGKHYIESSGIPWRIDGSYPIENYNIEDKKVVYCGYFIRHWGHFLIESVARLWYIFKNDSSVEKYVFFVSENESVEITGNYNEFLELLGIRNKIEIINTPTRYKEIVVPELGYQRMKGYTKEYLKIFEKVSEKALQKQECINSAKYENIFFTRSQLRKAKKSDIGTEMLDDFFCKNSYEIFAPEKLSLSEMIWYIRNANICAAVSGTLPHNMLFAKEGQTLLIIERNILNNEIQIDINRMKNLNVTYIDANIGIYPINSGLGPWIIAYRGKLAQYANDHNMQPPASKFYSKYYMYFIFRKYMKSYRNYYGYSWFMEEWMIEHMEYIKEAYDEMLEFYASYLKPKSIKRNIMNFFDNFKFN